MNKHVYHKADIIQCDILNPPFRQYEYIDVIVSNPPYLPIDEELTLSSISIEDLSWYGGIDGRSVIEAIINLSRSILVRGGLLYIVQSSISNIDKTLEILSRASIKGKVVKRAHIFFEDIVVIKAIKQ